LVLSWSGFQIQVELEGVQVSEVVRHVLVSPLQFEVKERGGLVASLIACPNNVFSILFLRHPGVYDKPDCAGGQLDSEDDEGVWSDLQFRDLVDLLVLTPLDLQPAESSFAQGLGGTQRELEALVIDLEAFVVTQVLGHQQFECEGLGGWAQCLYHY